MTGGVSGGTMIWTKKQIDSDEKIHNAASHPKEHNEYHNNFRII